MSEADRQRNIDAMSNAADRAGGFVKIVEQLQKQEEVEVKVGWDSCGIKLLQKGDMTVVRRVGSDQFTGQRGPLPLRPRSALRATAARHHRKGRPLYRSAQ